ncbi:armadillo-type protein, partial [Protomyces lactucae-debilis]
MADEQEDYDALPLEDKLLHKVWKVRLNAYEEATRAFTSSPNDNAPCFKLFNADPDLLVKAVKDANVVAQEAGVALVLAYLTYGPMHSTLKTRAQVIPALVEKCLGSTRAGTRQKAIETVLMYVELDSGEPVIEDLIPGLSAKLPKLVAATTLCIKSVYAAFGAKTVKAKPAVQVLPKLFAHADKNVRAEAIDLAITLYRWLGDVVKPLILADLKPVQVKELEQAFDGITVGDVKQERLLKSQQAAQEAAGGADDAAVDVAEEQEEQAVDAFDLAEPVDVLSTIPKNFEEAMLSSKWKDRKEVLDALVESSKVPRIKEGDFGEVARLLGRCVQKDANVVCVSLAATCLEQLAKGLKRAFGRYRNVVFMPCAERFKEKKQNVLDAIAGALDAVFLTTTLEDVLEETLELLKSKNPSVRCQMLLFLSRSLSVTPVFPKQGEVKAIAEGATALIGESDAKVRDAAAECLGTLMKLIGERAMGPYLEQIEELRKPKILECFAVATVKAKPEKPKPVPAAAAGKPQPSLARPPVSLESQAPVLAPADRLELESLRREKAAWLATAGDRDELNALRAQLQELQSKNASLIESHTKHTMELKAIEGPYMSTLRELEHMRSVCTKSEMEIDALKKQL